LSPSIAFPYHDPDLQLFPHLQAILPDLKALFKRAYICPPLNTRQHTSLMDWFEKDDFFAIFPLDRQLRIGEHFTYLYTKAAQAAEPEEMLHLAYVDRLSCALEGQHREQFIRDIQTLRQQDLPLIFQRSQAAWQTHPRNYAQLEGFVTRMGEILFGKTLDYGWCHLVVQAGELREVMSKVTHPGLSMVAEMVLHLQYHVQTREVDWLAWEDPFILGHDREELMSERENSLEETEKRLSYVLPMVEALAEFSKTIHHREQN
jgi:hypothetical protein